MSVGTSIVVLFGLPGAGEALLQLVDFELAVLSSVQTLEERRRLRGRGFGDQLGRGVKHPKS
jgi:hypothetical protein